jgi:hypothetical protein
VELEPEGLGWNWHKISGFATLAAGAVTIVTGFQDKSKTHNVLAYTTTALAITSICTGFYRYGDKIGFSADKTKDTIHAAGCMLATIGFVATSVIPANSKAHCRIGASSGTIFLISIGTLYF